MMSTGNRVVKTIYKLSFRDFQGEKRSGLKYVKINRGHFGQQTIRFNLSAGVRPTGHLHMRNILYCILLFKSRNIIP